MPKNEIKEFGLGIGALFNVRNEELNLVLHGDGVEASNDNSRGGSPEDPIAAQSAACSEALRPDGATVGSSRTMIVSP